MKNKTYILGIITIILISLGAYFKIQHWPGSGILLMGGFLIFSLFFLPYALYSSFKAEENRRYKTLYIVAGCVIAFNFIGSLFKIMHWPGSSILMIIAIPLPFVVLLPMLIYYNGNGKEINYKNFLPIMFFFAYFAAISSLLSVGVSKNLIDSYTQSANNFDSMSRNVKVQTEAMIATLQNDSSINAAERESIANIQKQTKIIEDKIEDLKKYLVLEKTGNPSDVYQNEVLNVESLLYKDNKLVISDRETDDLYLGLTKFKALLLSVPDLTAETRSYIETTLMEKEDWNRELFNQRLLISAIGGLNLLKYKVQTAQFAVLVR